MSDIGYHMSYICHIYVICHISYIGYHMSDITESCGVFLLRLCDIFSLCTDAASYKLFILIKFFITSTCGKRFHILIILFSKQITGVTQY